MQRRSLHGVFIDGDHSYEAVRADLQAADSVGKADKSPVTVADFAAQAILVLRLREAFPTIPIVAEEDADALAAVPHPVTGEPRCWYSST